MKPYILLLISCILLTLHSSAQLSYKEKVRLFTDSVFAKAHRFNNKLVVAETTDTLMYGQMREALKKGPFLKRISYDKGKTIIADTFQLTIDELNYVDTFLQSASKSMWTAEYINSAIFLPKDTVNKIYSTHANEIDSYLSKHYGDRRIFFLTKPIFLRNDTICIFKDDMDCGVLCGGGDLTIYKKINNIWTSYMILQEWVE